MIGAIWGFRLFVAATLISIVFLALNGSVHRWALLSLTTVVPAYTIDRMIRGTSDWKDLHDRGVAVRMFYLANGAILLLSVLLFG
jgi:hypothetical protein